MAGFLPLISMSGVIAYLQSKKQSWLKRIIWICTGFALVPVLNSLFFALNSSYYARWFYMPILMMALATVISLEDHKIDLYRGMKWTLFITLGFMCIGIIPNVVDGEITLGLEGQPFKFWVNSAIALISLAGTFLIVSYFRNKNRKDQKIFIRALTVGVCVITVAYSCFYIGTGKSHSEYNQWIINTGINGRQNIDLNDNEFFRVDVFEGLDNQAMFWKMPTIQTFHSIVPASIMEFYPQVGVTRDVGSRPSADLYALRSLLSVKYLFSQDEKETQPAMPGFSYYTNQNGFNIYKNDNFIPMGFTYDYYLTQSMFDSTTTSYRGNLLLKGVLLSDMQILKHSDILKMYPDIEYPDYSDEALANDCANRRAESSYYFAYDNYGFTIQKSTFPLKTWCSSRCRGMRAGRQPLTASLWKLKRSTLALWRCACPRATMKSALTTRPQG